MAPPRPLPNVGRRTTDLQLSCGSSVYVSSVVRSPACVALRYKQLSHLDFVAGVVTSSVGIKSRRGEGAVGPSADVPLSQMQTATSNVGDTTGFDGGSSMVGNDGRVWGSGTGTHLRVSNSDSDRLHGEHAARAQFPFPIAALPMTTIAHPTPGPLWITDPPNRQEPTYAMQSEKSCLQQHHMYVMHGKEQCSDTSLLWMLFAH